MLYVSLYNLFNKQLITVLTWLQQNIFLMHRSVQYGNEIATALYFYRLTVIDLRKFDYF